MRHLSTLVLAAVLAAGAFPVQAQDGASAAAFAATTLKLDAYGEAPTTPDMATITVGVETIASTAAGALGANAARMTEVAAALKRSGVASSDLQTAGLSLSPQYVYEQNKPARLTGYAASNQLTVNVRDLSRLGSTADAVVAAGATNVGQIAFGLSAPVAAEDRARVAAVKALEDKAALYARAAGYQIRRLVSLSEATEGPLPAPRPMAMMAIRGQAAPSTPVEAGELKVRVDITGVFELVR